MAAAAAADVVIHELHRPEELKAARRLFEDIWRPAEGNPPPMTAELLRALAHAGSYVAGASAGTRLVGASARSSSAVIGGGLPWAGRQISSNSRWAAASSRWPRSSWMTTPAAAAAATAALVASGGSGAGSDMVSGC